MVNKKLLDAYLNFPTFLREMINNDLDPYLKTYRYCNIICP